MAAAGHVSDPRGLGGRLREQLARLGDPRRAWLVVAALALVYVVTFAFSYPQVITVSDEESYLRQAQVIVQGERTVPANRLVPERQELPPASRYPLGTALFLAPFVSLGGWEAGFLCPFLCHTGRSKKTRNPENSA